MKIVVLMGSPNNNGSSAHLAENFIRGAKELHDEAKSISGAGIRVGKIFGMTDRRCLWHKGQYVKET